MPFTPLTQDQYTNAMKAGFTPDQIMGFEIKRKNQTLGKDAYPEAQANLAKEQQKNSLIRASAEVIPDAIYGLGDIPVGAVIRHGFGAIQSTIHGDGPISGFKDPDTQPLPSESLEKAYGVKLNTPSAIAFNFAVGLGTGHLLYGFPIKAAGGLYKMGQNAALDKFHSTLQDELKVAGMSPDKSRAAADAIVGHPTVKSMNPIQILQSERQIKGNLGNFIKDNLDAARSESVKKGYSPDFFKSKLAPRLTYDPSKGTKFLPNQALPLQQINLPPRRPVSSAFEITAPSVIPISDGRKSAVAQIKLTASNDTFDRRPSGEPNSDINVVKVDSNGVANVNESDIVEVNGKKAVLVPKHAKNIKFPPGYKMGGFTTSLHKDYDIVLVNGESQKLLTHQPQIESQSLYHETGDASLATVITDAHGLNVSTDKDLALGQHGKGVIIEFDKNKLLGNRGSLSGINKPGTPFVGKKEFSVIGGIINPGAVKSVTIKPTAKITTVQLRRVKLTFPNVEKLPDGSIKFTPSTQPSTKQLTHPAQQTPPPTKIGGAEPPPSLKTTPSTQPLPPYKNTPEINQRYLEYEKTAPDIHSMNVKDLKLSVVRSSESAMKLPKDVTKVPIMIDKDNKVIDGNHRLIRARLTGQKKINVISQPTQSIDPSIEKYTIAEKRLEKIRSSLTDKQLADISRSKLLKTRIIPVRLDELDKSPHIADEVLQRQGNQDPKVIEKAKQIKTIPTPEITAPGKTETPQTLKQTRLSDAKKSTEDYHPNTFWDVTFSDEHGNQNEMVDGPGLRVLEKLGYTIIKKNKLASEKGELNLEPLHDLLTNIHGELEKANNEFGYVAKTFGNSFFIGEKYPPFGKVIKALQDPIDESNEMFYNGVQKLNRSHGESLSTPHQERVNQALNYGDSQSVQKYFTPNELKSKFDLTPEEIKAYQGFVDMYKHGLDIVVKTRKLEEPDLQEGDIRNQLDRLGGYISHTRLGGDWAVYQPGDKEDSPPKFFDLFHNKSSAEKMSKTLDGSKVYLKTNIPRNDYGTMSIHDLQSLAEAQDVNPQSPDYLALKEELMKRSASKNWIRRNWVPRAEQSLRDKYDNAIDYLNGQTARYARVKGRIDAQKAMNENLKLMSPSLARYANKLIDTYHSGSSVDSNKIFQALNKTVYAYRLMFKTSFFLQHLTHPISITYPELSKGLKGLDTEAIFFDSYNMSRKYALHKITGTPHGLSTDTINMMETLQHQGYLGDQLNKFQMDSRTRFRTGFEHFIGSMARVSEGTNRIHSAMAGMLKAYNLGINDPQIKLDFVKNFMKKTVFQYDKLYTPYLVTGSGSVRNILNTMYRFRSFEVNYLHTLASHFRSGVGASLRAIGGMTAMAGISGLPFYALLTMAYLWKTGHTLDNDTRQAMREAHIPDKVIDLSLHGVPSLAGADLSSLIGTADIISPYGDAASKIGGPSVGFVEQMGEAGYYVSLGDRERALEKASPDFISRILRGQRYAREGIRKENGDTILANPSNFDIAISKLGIQPLDFTKAYQARDEKDAVQSGEQKRSAQYNTILAKKLESKDFPGYSDILDKIQSYNKTARPGDEIVISSQGIKEAYARMINGKKYPRHMESVIQQINERYGIK